VHPCRGLPTPGAPRRIGTHPRCQPHPTRTVPRLAEHDTLEMRQQLDKITRR
jgi:hypothetical protein